MQLHDSLSITIVWAVSQPKVKPDHNSHHQLVFNRVATPQNQSQMLLSRAAWYNCFNFPGPTPKQLTKQLNTNASAKSSNHKNESHDPCSHFTSPIGKPTKGKVTICLRVYVSTFAHMCMYFKSIKHGRYSLMNKHTHTQAIFI